jgi:hypothetical protein
MNGYVELFIGRISDSHGIDAVLTMGIQPVNARQISN